MEASSGSATGAPVDLERGDRQETEAVLPASFGQEGIELQHQLAGGTPIFNVPAALELTGKLDRGALHRSIGEIARRHDLLRTTFERRDGALMRVVRPPGQVDLPVRDLQDVPVGDRVAAARRLLDDEAARPFELHAEPGLRCLLVALDDDKHVFFWNMHHIVCDGWSKSVFAAELSEFYTAFAAGRSPDMPHLAVSYSDFVEHQRRLSPDALSKQLSYWDEHLAGVETQIGVPTDHPRATETTRRGDSMDFSLSRRIREQLVSLARRNGASLFMALHAAWASLLHRVSGQSNVVISVPFGSRPSENLEPLIGFFVNVLAMRTEVRGDQSFADLLERVRDTAFDGYENHEVPFQHVAERVLSRRGGRADGFQQASLAFANLPYQNVLLEGLQVERYALTRVDIRYELELHVWEEGDDGGLGGRLIYRSDLFEAATASALVEDLCAILSAVAEDPAVRVSDLPVASRPRPAAHDDWSWDDDGSDSSIVEPRTPVEAAVHEIWVDLLHYEDIGVDDNFLTVGGNSFLVALMVSKIRSELGVQLSVPQIMRNPTVEGIAESVDAALRGE